MSIKIKKENQQIKVSDLALAASISIYYPIEAIDRPPNSNRCFFLFEKNEELKTLIDNYHKGEMRVEPARFFNQIKIIKSRLYGTE